MNIQSFLKKYASQIEHLDLEILLSATVKKSREFILTHPDRILSQKKIRVLKSKIRRRQQGKPLAYLLGEKEFYGLKFKVNRKTLVPRPETEKLVEEALKSIHQKGQEIKKILIIDIGTGSGNIIISLVKSLGNLKKQSWKFKFFGSDLSAGALRLAKENARKNKVGKKIKFFQGNLLDPLFKKSFGLNTLPSSSWLVLTANLPYLSKKIYQSSSPEVRIFEPREALLSSKRGLSHYLKLLEQIKKIKKKNSLLKILVFLEFSPEQKNPLEKIFQENFSDGHLVFFKDLAGKNRVVRAEL